MLSKFQGPAMVPYSLLIYLSVYQCFLKVVKLNKISFLESAVSELFLVKREMLI